MYSKPEARHSGYTGSILSIIMIGLIGYLGFAAIRGQHGLLRLFAMEREEDALRIERAQIQAERVAVGNRVNRLSEDRLDLDLLDERARRVLGLGHPDELIVD